MEILYLLIPIGLILIVVAVRLLFWAIKNGQYDDLDTEGERILFEDKLDWTTTVEEKTAPKTIKKR